MKLVAIMSVAEYADALHDLVQAHRIPVYSETDIRGYHTDTPADVQRLGWFGRTDAPTYSHLAFAFLNDAEASALLDAIADHNDAHDLDHPLRAFLMPVERAV
jgi:hypothetical protein